MNEHLNLCITLKNCPKGTKFWSPIWGNVFLNEIKVSNCKPITLTAADHNYIALHSNGKIYDIEGTECMVFPSQYQRDWSKFKIPVKRFNPEEFKPFDKVLVRDGNKFEWTPNFFGKLAKNQLGRYVAGDIINRHYWRMCIPYNSETQNLLGTIDECLEFYRWWEE